MEIYFCLWGRQENAVLFEFWRQTTWTHIATLPFLAMLVCFALLWQTPEVQSLKRGENVLTHHSRAQRTIPPTASGPCGRAEHTSWQGAHVEQVAHSSGQEGGQSGWKGLGAGGGGGGRGMGWRSLWIREKREKDTVCSYFKDTSPVALLPLTLKISRAGNWASHTGVLGRSFRSKL